MRWGEESTHGYWPAALPSHTRPREEKKSHFVGEHSLDKQWPVKENKVWGRNRKMTHSSRHMDIFGLFKYLWLSFFILLQALLLMKGMIEGWLHSPLDGHLCLRLTNVNGSWLDGSVQNWSFVVYFMWIAPCVECAAFVLKPLISCQLDICGRYCVISSCQSQSLMTKRLLQKFLTQIAHLWQMPQFVLRCLIWNFLFGSLTSLVQFTAWAFDECGNAIAYHTKSYFLIEHCRNV